MHKWHRERNRARSKGRVRGILKFVVLEMLSDLPRHGYDLMRAARERGWDAGPGSVYPLLSILESAGYVTSRSDGDRRTYEITEKGRTLLHERAADVASFFKRAAQEEEPVDELEDALERLGAAVEQLGKTAKPQTIERVREMLDRSRKEIYTLLAQE
ncbi:MAG: PadR family transcriptional regulator [Candidatus Tyrphobacter sp.]